MDCRAKRRQLTPLLMSSLFMALAPLVAWADDAPASAQWMSERFPTGKNFCFGHVYDAAHLAAHPHQKVEAVYFYQNVDWDRGVEDDPAKRASPTNASSSEISGGIFMTKREGRKHLATSAECSTDRAGSTTFLSCGADCDRQVTEIVPAASGAILLRKFNRDIDIDPGDEHIHSQNWIEANVRLGTDDDNFLLEALPLKACEAAQAAELPSHPELGQPLRKRWAASQPLCYGRDYDQAHLAAHPQQLVTKIRLSREAEDIAADQLAGRLRQWPENARMRVTVTRRLDTTSIRQMFVCSPDRNQWRCGLVPSYAGWDCAKGSNGSDCSAKQVLDPTVDANTPGHTIFLRRAADNAVVLGNPENGLPLTDTAHLFTETASDDKAFRLFPMPASKCQ